MATYLLTRDVFMQCALGDHQSIDMAVLRSQIKSEVGLQTSSIQWILALLAETRNTRVNSGDMYVRCRVHDATFLLNAVMELSV